MQRQKTLFDKNNIAPRINVQTRPLTRKFENSIQILRFLFDDLYLWLNSIARTIDDVGRDTIIHHIIQNNLLGARYVFADGIEEIAIATGVTSYLNSDFSGFYDTNLLL